MDRMPNLAFDPSKMAKSAADEYTSSESDGDGDDDDFLMPSTDPNVDEFRDYNPRKRRRTGRDPKESAALGIFGSESEDDDGGPGKRWKRKTNLRNKGMSFVSSGKQAAESDEEDGDQDKDEEDEDVDPDDERPTMRAMQADADEQDDDDEDEAAAGIGLGFGTSAAGGLGWGAPTQQAPDTTNTPTRPAVRTKFDGSTPLGRGFVPSSANEPVLKVKSDASSEPKLVARPSAFSSKSGKTTKDKSFGARMMAKMGYVEGRGLGKEEQGRNVIIEANLRPQNIGLGAVREKTEQERKEERRQARMRGEEVVDSDEEEKKRKAAARRKKALAGGVSGGGASGASTPRRQKPRFMTMDEVKKAAPGLNIPEAFTPILDLTGPGKKMLTSSSGLMTPTATGTPIGESTESAESRKLARRAQNDFMAIVEEWQGLQERKAYTDLQLRQAQQELDELDNGVRGYESITNVLSQLAAPEVQSGSMDELGQRWDKVISLLREAQTACSEAVMSVMQDELAAISVAAIHPLFKSMLATWDPLEEPRPRFIADFTSIKALVGVANTKSKPARRATATPYEAMMYKLWLPHVARAVREWKVRGSDQLLAVVEAWDELLPRFVRNQLLEQDIVRKLDEAISKWDPKRKKHHSLPHLWLFPWLQYLSAHHLDPKSTTGLVADVKRKFRQLIAVWEFDRGVIPGLKQWKDLLRPAGRDSSDQWRPLVMNHVLPSMARYLRTNFRVDPSDQAPYVPMLTGVFEWTDLLSPAMVGEVIVAEVFPMWLETLYQWLILDDVNYEEVGEWFGWWHDEVFPDEIRALPSVAAELAKGNAMIEEALDLGDQVKTRLNKPQKGPAYEVTKTPPRESHHKPQHHPHHRHHHNGTAHGTAAAAAAAAAAEPEDVSFRSVLEDWCQNNDLQFIPERKKAHVEGPLYRVTARGDGRGGVLGYFKGDQFCVETKQGLQEFRREKQENWGSLFELAH